ncbi:glycerol 3-phosphate dehydrogenase [Lewinellaceae bacterium SD302]|nr:glycerol 3-phosphate dehydrogenase [Lewinellaceae bacterium SD302]
MEESLECVGVIGAGSFGVAVANLLAKNTDVKLYARKPEQVKEINERRFRHGVAVHERITAINSLEDLATGCQLIFPIVPSSEFRKMMQSLGPFLRPSHVLVHGTKGLDYTGPSENGIPAAGFKRTDLHTMTEVIRQESLVVRTGILAGPNLAREILDGQPTATVIASKFDEVIERAQAVLASDQLFVFGNHDLLGAELAGVLKNVIALGSGILKGYGFGKNIQAMLITRGFVEMIHFGRALGSDTRAFFGTAGIGDLIATATSRKSRNYTFGYRIGTGETLEDVRSTSVELAEGVRTLMMTRHLAKTIKLRVPITEMLYRIIFEGFPVDKAMDFLMSYPYDVDVDFL